MLARFLRTFPAFENRNFRLFFLGQVISFAGTWLQSAAQVWLVYQMTRSAIAVGITGFLLVVPTMALASFGGVIIDGFNTRKVLYITQLLSMAQAFVFGMLVVTGHISLVAINVLAFTLGIINGLDAPARHACITEVVGKDILPSATAMNAALVNLGLMLGPSVAGVLIAKFGMGATFFVNSASFLAVIATLFLMRIGHLPEKQNGQSFAMFWPGVRYAASDPNIRFFLCLGGIMTALGFPFRTILPVAAKEMFHLGPAGFGWLYASPGFGAIIGAAIVSRYSKRLPVRRFIIGGAFVTGASLIVFSMLNALGWGMFTLMFAGASFVCVHSTSRATLRAIVDRKMLGRVIGLDVTLFFGGMAAGNFAIGYFSEWCGVQWAIRGCGFALLLLGAVLLWRTKPTMFDIKQGA